MLPQSALVVFAGVEKILVVKDGKAREQRVRTGARVGDRVEIVDGVSAGDSGHPRAGRPRRRLGRDGRQITRA